MNDPVIALAAFLKRENLTQGALAEKVELDRTEVSHILARRRNPGRDSALAIQNITGIPAEWWGQKRRGRRKKAD